MLVYATPTQVREYAHAVELPEDDQVLVRLIRMASATIRNATRRAIYDTTPAGLPKDVDVEEAFREATCAQVAAICTAGLEAEVFTGGVTQPAVVRSSSINGGSVTYDTSSADDARALLLGGGLCPEATMLLDAEGLLRGLPAIYY